MLNGYSLTSLDYDSCDSCAYICIISHSAALLDGFVTTPERLAENSELLQFWKVLSASVTLSSTNDGRRVDLLGCRVVESPREGAALLKELWSQTAVPFAAADDALGGYK